MAIQDGGPLQIPSSAPKTLTEAFYETVKNRGTRGIRFIEADGKQSFLSYADLQKKALRILTGLRSKGLKQGDRVILQIDSYPKHFSALWACIFGGITPVTVAIAPTYDDKNGVTSKVINTWKLLEAPTVLTTESLMPRIRGLETVFEISGLRALSVDELERHEPATEIYHPEPTDLVFFQLTSGSTGVPKCIQETHKGIVTHIQAGMKFNGYGPEDITFNWLPLDHVVPTLTWHLRDVYHGAEQIHAKPDLVLSSPLKWLDVIDQFRVTQTWAPNFGFKLVADQLKKQTAGNWDLSSIRFFMNAGEQVTMPVVAEFLTLTKQYGVRENMMQPAFGMAEVCTCMTYANNFSIKTGAKRFLKTSLRGKLELAEGDDSSTTEFVSLGPPVPGVQIRIADGDNCLVQEGVIGRFQIKGDVVTPGYLNNEIANKESFVGNGWFNSGDLGFILDGELFLTGREKEMIIVRGANFYCYEIEDVVNSVPGVTPTFTGSCSVADPKTGTEGLAIFFVPLPGFDGKEVAREIKRRVAANLGITASFTVPLQKSEFPKTTSGKIQRTQLRKNLEGGVYETLLAEISDTKGELTSPTTELEQKVAEIWREILQQEQIGLESNFFDLGGDSLRGMQILSRVRENCRVELQFIAFFAGDSSLGAFCRKIASATGEQFARTPIPKTTNGSAPLSYPQQRIWLMEQITPGTTLYNVTRAVWLNGPIDRPALERAITNILQRHEVLRATFNFENGKAIQKITSHLPFTLPSVDISQVPASEREATALRLAGEEGSLLFNLKTGPLFRASLIKTDATQQLLIVCFHQIVVDGWSMGIFFRELAAEYDAVRQEKSSGITLPIQYTDFAQWQAATPQDNPQQLSYWKTKLTGINPRISLKGARKHTANVQGQTETVVLQPELARSIKLRAQSQGATTFMLLLAAYKALLNFHSGQQDLSVGTAIASRTRTEIENLIGFFVNTLALRTKVDPSAPARELIANTRDTCLQAFENADIPFEKIVEKVGASASPGESPFFDVWFSVFDEMPPFKLGEASAQTCHVPPTSAQFPLALFVVESGENITCYFEYRTSSFDAEVIRKIICNYTKLLEAMAKDPAKKLEEIFALLTPAISQPSLASARRKVVSAKTV